MATKREHWWVLNTTTKILTIGDLLPVPEFMPGATHDILRYVSRERAENSKVLSQLLKNGWFKMRKQDEDEAMATYQVSVADVNDVLSSPNIKELKDVAGSGGGGGGGGTVASRTFSFFT